MNNPRANYDTMIDSMPAGLDRAVLRIVIQHNGVGNAISKADFIATLELVGFHVRDERQLREVVHGLRQDGHLICSSSGHRGYYMALNREEYDEFSEREYRKKIIDMAKTLKAMDGAAVKKYGERVNNLQGRLI